MQWRISWPGNQTLNNHLPHHMSCTLLLRNVRIIPVTIITVIALEFIVPEAKGKGR